MVDNYTNLLLEKIAEKLERFKKRNLASRSRGEEPPSLRRHGKGLEHFKDVNRGMGGVGTGSLGGLRKEKLKKRRAYLNEAMRTKRSTALRRGGPRPKRYFTNPFNPETGLVDRSGARSKGLKRVREGLRQGFGLLLKRKIGKKIPLRPKPYVKKLSDFNNPFNPETGLVDIRR